MMSERAHSSSLRPALSSGQGACDGGLGMTSSSRTQRLVSLRSANSQGTPCCDARDATRIEDVDWQTICDAATGECHYHVRTEGMTAPERSCLRRSCCLSPRYRSPLPSSVGASTAPSAACGTSPTKSSPRGCCGPVLHYWSATRSLSSLSSTLDRVDWNAEIVSGGQLGKAVQQLKRQPGKGLFVGGVKLPLALAKLGLI